MEQMRRPGSTRSTWRPCKMKGSNNLVGKELIEDSFSVPCPFSSNLFTDSKSISLPWFLSSAFPPPKQCLLYWRQLRFADVRQPTSRLGFDFHVGIFDQNNISQNGAVQSFPIHEQCSNVTIEGKKEIYIYICNYLIFI